MSSIETTLTASNIPTTGWETDHASGTSYASDDEGLIWRRQYDYDTMRQEYSVGTHEAGRSYVDLCVEFSGVDDYDLGTIADSPDDDRSEHAELLLGHTTESDGRPERFDDLVDGWQLVH